MKRKRRKIQQRIPKRLEISVPLNIKLLGIPYSQSAINGETRNVSLDGLLIELPVIFEDGILLIDEKNRPVKLIPFLVLNEKRVESEIRIPPDDVSITAIGRVIWYDFGSRDASYGLRFGVFLEEMEGEDTAKWEFFVESVAGGTDTESSRR